MQKIIVNLAGTNLPQTFLIFKGNQDVSLEPVARFEYEIGRRRCACSIYTTNITTKTIATTNATVNPTAR